MQKLPPLSPGLSLPNGGLSMADHIDKENPFENTWSILKALKAEVRELQTAVVAEQQMRQNEVNDIRRELLDLREQLKKEREERIAETRRIIDPVDAMTNSIKEELRKVKAQREQQINELNEALADERLERQADVRDLRAKLAEENNARSTGVKDLTKDLEVTKRDLEATGNQARENIRNLTQDVRAIVDQMIRVNNTWGSFKSDQIVSHRPQQVSQHSPSRTTSAGQSTNLPSGLSLSMTSSGSAWTQSPGVS
jgi:predicted phage tail protein